MKKTIGICLFVGIFLVIGVSVLLITANTKQEQEEQNQIVADENIETTELSTQENVTTESMAKYDADHRDYEYLILEKDGVLVVYLGDGTTVFLETDIPVYKLDTTTLEKLKSGIAFSDEKELYDFLESHSS